MVKYKLSGEAENDLYQIWLFGLKQFGQEQADKYLDAFFDRFEQIARQPHLYPEVSYIRPGYRRSVCGIDSIFYRINDATVEIVRVIGNQDISKIFS
jgi:toxin ParE1/3/4